MARLRNLVIVLPGIGGSELAHPGGLVAATTGGYALTFRGLARTLIAPERLGLDTHPRLDPVRLIDDLAILPPLVTLPGYRRLGRRLRRAFPEAVIDSYRPGQVRPDTDVLLIPYDFRRSVAEAAVRVDEAVSEALSHRLPRRDRIVIVLAHSLGGLVARYWIGLLDGWRHCRTLITLGTPARGAPKALDWLINGAGVGRLRDPRLTRVIRGWPSMYELLPQYAAVWDTVAATPVELTTLPAALTSAQPGLADYAATFAAMTGAARDVHERIQTGWDGLSPEQRPSVLPYLARGHATLNLAELDGCGLRVSKQDPAWRGNVGWAGDGTVPALSAIPLELANSPEHWRIVSARHGSMGSIADPIEVLRSYAGDRVPIRGDRQPDLPWLALDLEDFVRAGEPVQVAVALLPGSRAEHRVRGEQARVLVTPVDGRYGRRQFDLPADPGNAADLAWRGELPPLAPGVYAITIEVTGVPEVGLVAADETVVVLGGESP